MNIVAYAELNGSVVIDYPVYQGDIQNAHPQTSFPTPFIPPEGYVAVYETPQPSYDWITQNINQGTPTENGGNWFQTWVVSDATPEQIAERQQSLKQRNKQQAESLLQATDWTEGKSVRDVTRATYMINGDEFDDYRVALRVIAVNPPVTVEDWPVKPDEQWSTQ